MQGALSLRGEDNDKGAQLACSAAGEKEDQETFTNVIIITIFLQISSTTNPMECYYKSTCATADQLTCTHPSTQNVPVWLE